MKVLVILLICVLTLYSPLELSRLILKGTLEWYEPFELAFLWSFYAMAVVVLTKVVRV